MANTFELINSYTLGSAQSAITFSSIPSTYTDLVLMTSVRNTAGSTTMYITFNNDTTNSYSVRLLTGDGSSAGSTSSAGRANIKNDGGADDSGYTASTFASSTIYIPNYSGSSQKSISFDGVPENNATTTYMNLGAGLWTGTSAINRIDISVYAGNLATYSTAYLYGVKNA